MTERKKNAVYLRISQEDKAEEYGKKSGQEESNSISNQRKMIQMYIRNNPELSVNETVEFCDDGYSGTSMKRPGMQNLLEEIKKNQIGCILVKDMSRFSRDYIELGVYLNQIFPFMGIRLIAINDHYDSRDHEGSTIAIDTAFQTLLYDLYSKDISIKWKAAFLTKCEQGEYVFGQVPFGYEKSRKIKNTVIVKKEEAEIVCYIFSLAAAGKSIKEIAKQFYEEKIPTATQMRHPERLPKNRIHTWSSEMIRKILTNRFYLGEMTYGKSVRERVGSQKGIAVPKEQWKVIPEHHEPLVTAELFALAAPPRSNHSTKRKREKHPLVGKIFCGGCGYSLNYKPQSKSTKYAHFWCRKHGLLQVTDCCTYYNAKMLEETILLKLYDELIHYGSAKKQGEELIQFGKAELEALRRRLKEYKTQLRSLIPERNSLYERYRSGQFMAKEYRHMADELDEKMASFEKSIQETETAYTQAEEAYRKKKEDMEQIIRYSHIESLTQEVVDVFIKRIDVYGNKRVEIEWNFAVDF